MQSKLDFRELRKKRSAVILHHFLAQTNLRELPISDLVGLRALFAKLLSQDNIRTVPDAILATYIGLLSDRPLKLPAVQFEPTGVRHVTVLFQHPGGGSHVDAVAKFLTFLAWMPSLDQIDLVISAEIRPGIWKMADKTEHLEPISAALDTVFREFALDAADSEKMRNKIRITIAPEAEELRSAIGQLVIRYEGSLPTHQCRICSTAIFDQRPVLATVGTAAIAGAPDIDLLITPAVREYQDHELHFLRPLPKTPNDAERNRFVPPADGGKILLSGYTNDKLARGLRGLGAADWDAMAHLFRNHPEFRWHLFGAENTDAVWQAMPGEFRSEFSKQLIVSEMIDLDTVFERAFAFLALPDIGGSGTTAKLALRHAVPVLVCRSGERDISNMFPDPPEHHEFTELVDQLEQWAGDIDERTRFLGDQIDNINQRAELETKAGEMRHIFERAVSLYLARSSAGGA